MALRGYLLLGLVIGMAGLAVSQFRAARERRRQIGMMRAMGLTISGVRRWFMTEATFVSLMGIVTGVGLGVLTGYLTTTRPARRQTPAKRSPTPG
jgi:putative ABC transport system permease protein